MIKLGSLFSGIGGFELGLERAIPNLETVWQVEQNKFCQSILKKHWPNSKIYNDVCAVGAHNLTPVDILCGGFPCQDISTAGKMEGIHGKKSGLWFEMWRIISELRPRIIVLENVPVITIRGLETVLGGLAKLGYDAEWGIVAARDFGAPHLRKRWFCVAYANENRPRQKSKIQTRRDAFIKSDNRQFTYTIKTRCKCAPGTTKPMGACNLFKCINCKNGGLQQKNYWQNEKAPPGLCELDDGIPARVAKLAALGNAIVPQCSEFIGQHIFNSGLLDDLFSPA